MKRGQVRRVLLLCSAWLVLGAPLTAQTTGALFGYVVDDRNGSPVVGAEVAVVGTATRATADAS